MVAALQTIGSGGRLAPEGWTPGEPLLLPVDDDTGKADWFCRRDG